MINHRTLTELVTTFEAEGYRGQMAAREGGFVLCLSCQMETPAGEMELDALERMEGASDPADMLAVAALVCPVCHTSGTLVLGYGPEADPVDADVLAALGDIDG
jgi:hypothetical protein